MKEVSVVRNLSFIEGKTAFEEMIFSIKRCDHMNVIIQLRKILASGDKSAYEKAKKALLAFTASATFDGRRLKQFMIEYNYLIVLDFDHLSPEDLIRLKEIICRCPFTVACFVSPSGNGLKVFVCVKSGPEKHLQAFLSAQRYYTALTGVEIDASGKDITRLCFVSWDPDLYYNPAAKVFDWEKGVDRPKSILANEIDDKADVGRALAALQGNEERIIKDEEGEPHDEEGEPQGLSLHQIHEHPAKTPFGNENIFKIYKSSVRYVEKYIQYRVGQRHNFILKLALEIRKRGVPEITTLFLIQQDFDLDSPEVSQIVRDVYQFDLTMANTDSIYQKKSPQPVVSTEKTIMTRKSRRDPDLDECIFPLIEEMDELFYSGGDTKETVEALSKTKPKGRMTYVQQTVEMMILKVLELLYNVVIGQVFWRRKGSKDPFQRMEDHDENSICRWLHLHDQFIPITNLHNILMSNFSTHFNPFIEYFKKLKKVDQKIDYIGQLIATVKTEDDEYWAFCFRKWFVAYAMSLYRKSVINHTVIVFVGNQGEGKSSWFRTLVAKPLKDYLSLAAMQADSKDTQIMVAECCLVILDELEAFNRRELNSFKDLITRLFLHVRKPYGRSSSVLTRYASFIASVNNTQILTDTSGSRRYLCSTVTRIDYKHTVDIDACMAQAIALGESGFKYWFDQDEIRELNEHNEAYMAKSVEEEFIETWLRPVTIEEWNDKENLTYGKNICLMKAADVSQFLTGKIKLTLLSNSNSIVGKIMKKLKFTRLCKDEGFFYIVRVLTDTEVAQSRRTLDDSDSPVEFENDLNRYSNPDRFIEGSRKEDELPF